MPRFSAVSGRAGDCAEDLNRVDATNVGRLLAGSRTSDITGAHVVICARRRDQQVVTSDSADLRALDPDIRMIPL